MINNSTWTADTLKTKLKAHFSDQRISNADIRLGLNFFYSVLGRARRASRRSDNLKTTGALSVTSSGYDLKANISDIANFDEGFQVFLGSLKKGSEIFPIQPEDTKRGFYISDTTLFLSQGASGTIYVKYQKSSPRIADSDALADHDLEIDQDLEQTVFRFCIENFYDGKFQDDRAMRNEDKYYQEVLSFFDRGTKTRNVTPW